MYTSIEIFFLNIKCWFTFTLIQFLCEIIKKNEAEYIKISIDLYIMYANQLEAGGEVISLQIVY